MLLGNPKQPDQMKRTVVDKQAGFTLLEMMIAMAIFAVLSVTAFTIMRQMITSDEILQARVSRHEELLTAMSIIEQDLNYIIPRTSRVDFSSTKESAIIAISSRDDSSDSLMITRNSWLNPNLILSRSQLQRVRYRLDEGNLIREYFPFVDRLPSNEPKKRVLLSNVQGLKFKYLQQNQWQDDWPYFERLPQAIEINLTTEQEGLLSRIFIMPTALSRE